MKDKIQNAIQDMRLKVERDNEHVYRLTETGQMLQGVSSVSSIVPKDWLAAWGAKEAMKALGYSDYDDKTMAEEIWNKIIDCDNVDEYIKILKDAKGAHARKSKKAMGDGKVLHIWLENFVKSRINGQNMVILPENELKRPLQQFLDWESKNIDYWIASEALVVNPNQSYGGQLDAICVLKTGELALIDFKFASNISEDYFLQTGGYAACFEPYGIKFDKRIIIRLPKTLEKDEYDKITHKYNKVPNDIEIKFVPTNYERDRDAFYAALIVKSWINKVTNNK